MRKLHYRSKMFKAVLLIDCAKLFWLPTVLNSLSLLCFFISKLAISNKLGDLIECAIKLDYQEAYVLMGPMVLYILASVVLYPLLGMFSDFCMFRKALEHDKSIYKQFFMQSFDWIQTMDLGKTQVGLENAPIDLRFDCVTILSSILMLLMGTVWCTYKYSEDELLIIGIITVFILGELLLNAFFFKRASELKNNEIAFNMRWQTHETAVLNNIQTIRSWGIINTFCNHLQQKFNKYMQQNGRSQYRLEAIQDQSMNYLNNILPFMICFFGIRFVVIGQLTIGQLTALLVCIDAIRDVVYRCYDAVKCIPSLVVAMETIRHYVDHPETMGFVASPQLETLTVSNISYERDGRYLLSSVSIQINKGDTICILGENGSGKSTLLRILNSLFTDYYGQILMNDTVMDSFDLDAYRDINSIVPQTPWLLNTTIMENVISGKKEDIGRVYKLLDSFGLSFDPTVRDTKGLSGGEIQKVSLARAFYRLPDILFLDEPENNLDEYGLRQLYDCINNNDYTTIMVTHAPQLIELATKCLYMNKGRCIDVKFKASRL